MLTGSEIKRLVNNGSLVIEPFNEDQINPNSYNLTLADTLLVYDGENPILETKKPNPTKKLIIPEHGIVLQPGILYLGSTVEYTKCGKYIGCIDGRSSIGRLGVQIHLTAGFGDIGFEGKWTLEISVIHPVRIYAGMQICQIYFESPEGDTDILYHGKYMNQDAPKESHSFEDFADIISNEE